MPPIQSIEVTFESAQKAKMKGGEEAYIFTLCLRNPGPRQARFVVRKASYTTVDFEEVDQSVWLVGHLIGGSETVVRAGTFKRIGLVFYTRSLANIRTGDGLRVAVDFADSSFRAIHTFSCSDAGLLLYSSVSVDTETIELPPDAKALGRKLNNGLERLEILEDKLGIALEGIYLQTKAFTTGFDVTVTGEVRRLDRSERKMYTINFTVFDDANHVIHAGTRLVNFAQGIPMAAFSATTPILPEVPARVRVYPTIFGTPP
jgi:hypothetical protein